MKTKTQHTPTDYCKNCNAESPNDGMGNCAECGGTKQKEVKHTPTPMKFDLKMNRAVGGWDIEGFGIVIARLSDEDYSTLDVEQWTAAFIVRCVNSHEALLKAAKQAASWVEQQSITRKSSEVLGDLFAAISQAEGK